LTFFFGKILVKTTSFWSFFQKKKKIGVDSLYLWPEPCLGLDFKTMIMTFYILTCFSWTNLELRIFYDDILKIKIKILSLEICFICTFYSGTAKIVSRTYLFLSLYLFLFNQIYFCLHYLRDSNQTLLKVSMVQIDTRFEAHRDLDGTKFGALEFWTSKELYGTMSREHEEEIWC
jgi:hypothetical protein